MLRRASLFEDLTFAPLVLPLPGDRGSNPSLSAILAEFSNITQYYNRRQNPSTHKSTHDNILDVGGFRQTNPDAPSSYRPLRAPREGLISALNRRPRVSAGVSRRLDGRGSDPRSRGDSARSRPRPTQFRCLACPGSTGDHLQASTARRGSDWPSPAIRANARSP
jgi:hypothetical protein